MIITPPDEATRTKINIASRLKKIHSTTGNAEQKVFSLIVLVDTLRKRIEQLEGENKTLEKKYKDLNDTVQISCNPPDDCNDPVVLKTYMKACFDEAQKGGGK